MYGNNDTFYGYKNVEQQSQSVSIIRGNTYVLVIIKLQLLTRCISHGLMDALTNEHFMY